MGPLGWYGRRQRLNRVTFFGRAALLAGATLMAVLVVEVGPASAVGKVSATVAAPAPAPGDVLIAEAGNNQVLDVPAGGGAQTTVGSGLSDPQGVAVDTKGDVFISDTANNRVVEVPAGGGPQTTVGSGPNVDDGVAVDAQGDLFFES